MIPLFPYSGILRPVIMAAVIWLSFFILRGAQNKPFYRQLLYISCAGYAFSLLYTTFLSRTVAETYAYLLEVLGSARSAFSVEGGLWSLINGDFAAIRIDNPCGLEGILINMMLMIPLGYLLPQVQQLRGRKISVWVVILCGSLCSVLIEVVQLYTRLGMLDVDDWLMNTISVGIGYVMFWFYGRRQR